MAISDKNEISAEFLGVVGLNPFAAYISASRLAMFCNHIGQRLHGEQTIHRCWT